MRISTSRMWMTTSSSSRMASGSSCLGWAGSMRTWTSVSLAPSRTHSSTKGSTREAWQRTSLLRAPRPSRTKLPASTSWATRMTSLPVPVRPRARIRMWTWTDRAGPPTGPSALRQPRLHSDAVKTRAAGGFSVLWCVSTHSIPCSSYASPARAERAICPRTSTWTATAHTMRGTLCSRLTQRTCR